MFDRIAPRYDALNRLLTFRMDVGWRRTAVRRARARRRVHACSTSRAAPATCAARSPTPATTPVGVDFSAGMLRAAHTDAPLVRADALRLPFADATFDGITCGFALRNFAALAPVLAECGRVLRAGRAHRAARRRRAREPARPRRCTAPGSATSCRSSAASSPTAPRTATCPRRPRTSRRCPSCSRSSSTPGIVDVSRRTLGFGAAQLITGTRAHDDLRRLAAVRRRASRRAAVAIDGPLDLLDDYAPDGFAWLDGEPRLRGVGRRRASSTPADAAAFLADDRPLAPTTRRLRRAPGRARSARCRSRARASSSFPRVDRRARRRRHARGAP